MIEITRRYERTRFVLNVMLGLAVSQVQDHSCFQSVRVLDLAASNRATSWQRPITKAAAIPIKQLPADRLTAFQPIPSVHDDKGKAAPIHSQRRILSILPFAVEQLSPLGCAPQRKRVRQNLVRG